MAKNGVVYISTMVLYDTTHYYVLRNAADMVDKPPIALYTYKVFESLLCEPFNKSKKKQSE